MSVLLLYNILIYDSQLIVLYPNLQAIDAFGGEVLCTFLLVMIVFAATDGQLCRKKAFIGPFFPWAISMAVFLGEVMLFIAPAIVHEVFNLVHGNQTALSSCGVCSVRHPMSLLQGEFIFRYQIIPR